MKKKMKTGHLLIAAIIAVFAATSLGFYSAYSNNFISSGLFSTQSSKNTKKYYFSTNEDGKKIHWKVTLRDGDIDLVYRDGRKLSKSEIESYSKTINAQIDELEKDLASIDTDFDTDYDFDSDINLPDSDCVYFDTKAFNAQMERLKEELKNMKPIHVNVNFDKNEFKKAMKVMRENLKNLKEQDFFNEEEFEKSMEKLDKELSDNQANLHFDFNFSDLYKSISKLKFNFKDLKIDMSKLKEKMKVLKSFFKDMRSELIKDGYLDKNDDDFDLNFTADKLEVNGKKLPDNLLQKYKDLYKKYFGKEIDSEGNVFKIIH